MFVFYSCLLSAITPPVALAAYAGAAIAGGNVIKTGIHAAKLGFVKYIVPFVFVYNAALLMEGNMAFILFSFATAFVGTIALSAAMEGFLLTFLSPFSQNFVISRKRLAIDIAYTNRYRRSHSACDRYHSELPIQQKDSTVQWGSRSHRLKGLI